MIRIRRTDCPNHLDTSVRNLLPNDHKDDVVVFELLTMQHFKCCYCEKSLPELGRTAKWVEHFIPKDDGSFKNAAGDTNWNKANSWTNLLYACSTCNRSKGTEKPFDSRGRRRLIDPSNSRINPERHIHFFIDESLIFYQEKNRSTLGKRTIKNLKLKTRTDVYGKLSKAKVDIDSIFSECIGALTEGNLVMANSKLNDLKRKTSAHYPHASFNRTYIQKKVDKFNNSDLDIINQNLGTNINPIIMSLIIGHNVII